jgi:creatinine amidohydrolase
MHFSSRRMRRRAVLLALLSMAAAAAPAPGRPASVFLEELTWTEVRDAIAAGRTTVIVPVGGTEQSGPHMALGKHNLRAHVLAGRIAEQLGDALVAPVIAYVPEGRIDPPTGHMKYPGTISVPDAAFKGVLEGAARSLRQAGFRDIVLIGDHGGYQTQLQAVATKLDREWAVSPARVHFVAEYYGAADTGFAEVLRQRGLSAAQIGTHAGAADTSLTLAIDPRLVRADKMAAAPVPGDGTAGDPRPSSAALGQIGVEQIVARSVAAIRAAVGR